MKLIIHDLDPAMWEDISHEYDGWTIISDNHTIKPCTGCFCCWHKTPGQCIINDGYDRMGYLIHHSEEVTVISRYTYGGFSGFIKNISDRCLGYVLPQFEIVNGESHHRKRYDENKPFTFIFYGENLNDREKESAVKYVNAVCTNMRTYVKEVIFRESGKTAKREKPVKEIPAGKTVLLNASMRWKNGNSAALAQQLESQLEEAENIALVTYLNRFNDLMQELIDAENIVLCTPLYVDGLPSQLIRLMETFRDSYDGPSKRIYVLANMGLYESHQLESLFESVRQWSHDMGFTYAGGLGVSAGELIGVLIRHLPFEGWPSDRIAQGMSQLSRAIRNCETIEDIYTEPHRFPRWLYIQIANRNWNRLAKQNCIDPKDLYRQL